MLSILEVVPLRRVLSALANRLGLGLPMLELVTQLELLAERASLLHSGRPRPEDNIVLAGSSRSGPAIGFAIALTVSFIYFLFLRTGQVLGHKGDLNPWIAAWIGNVVFGIGGIMAMIKVRK